MVVYSLIRENIKHFDFYIMLVDAECIGVYKTKEDALNAIQTECEEFNDGLKEKTFEVERTTDGYDYEYEIVDSSKSGRTSVARYTIGIHNIK